METFTQKTSFIYIDEQINDFRHFQEAVHDWGIDFHQLDGGEFYSRLQQIILPEIQIGHTHFNCHLDQKGHAPEGMWTFVVLGKDASMINFNHELTQSTSTLLIYAPRQAINATTYDGFEVYTFSVSESHLQKIAKQLGLINIEEKLSLIDRVELHKEQTNSLREQLIQLLQYAQNLEEKQLSQENTNLLLNLLPTKFLYEVHLHAGCPTKRVFRNKHILYMQVRSYIHTHYHTNISIAAIAQQYNISERTLRNYFVNELSLPPKQYLNIIRLHKVKNKLTSNHNYTSIEQVARSCGFIHMGQFSAAYKNFFGELPSQTLSESMT